jgi:hypothetical protein
MNDVRCSPLAGLCRRGPVGDGSALPDLEADSGRGGRLGTVARHEHQALIPGDLQAIL